MFLSSDERVILFKSPASDAYAQALLTAIGLPPNSRLKLTTYRSIWIPRDISEHPEKLNDKKALLVCADVDGNPPALQALYPLREVTIVRSRMLGQQLELVIETGGYVQCSDYIDYLSELRKSQPTLPPDEHSFIAIDRLRALKVVSNEESIQAWQQLVETLVGVKALRRAGFFCLTHLRHAKDAKILNPQTPEKDDLEPTSRSYVLEEDSKYTIQLLSLFPRHTERDGLGFLNLDITYPKWIRGEESVEIFGYSQEYQIQFVTRTKSEESFPTSIVVRPSEGTQSKAPKLELPLQLKSSREARIIRQIRQSGPMLIVVALTAFVYFYAQLMQSLKILPDVQGITTPSAEQTGAILSTIMLTVLTALFARLMASKGES